MCVCVYLCICFTKMLVTKGLVTQGLGLTSGAVTNTTLSLKQGVDFFFVLSKRTIEKGSWVNL